MNNRSNEAKDDRNPGTNPPTLPPSSSCLHTRYKPNEAADAIGMSVEDVRGWMEVGELEGIKSRGVIVPPWEELVSMAMDFWEQAYVEEALGTEVAEALPELLRLADLEVRIPRLEVAALEKRGARWKVSRCRAGARTTRSPLSAVGLAEEGDSRFHGGVCMAVLEQRKA